MSTRALFAARCLQLLLLWSVCVSAHAQTETIFQPVGMDTQRVFVHTALPGATGIDFSFMAGVAPTYPEEESHILVTVFEWGPTAIGPWSASPDNVNSILGGATRFVSTGVFHAPADAAFVALHFYAGAIMTVSGSFTHTSVVPEPLAAGMWLTGVGLIGWLAKRRGRRGIRRGNA